MLMQWHMVAQTTSQSVLSWISSFYVRPVGLQVRYKRLKTLAQLSPAHCTLFAG